MWISFDKDFLVDFSKVVTVSIDYTQKGDSPEEDVMVAITFADCSKTELECQTMAEAERIMKDIKACLSSGENVGHVKTNQY